MELSLSRIVKESMETSNSIFNRLVDETTRQLATEIDHVGDLQIDGRLVRMKPSGEAVVIGDLHGDLESLLQILEETAIMQRMSKSRSTFLIFLGDYGDRGILSPEVYYTVMRLKLEFPTQVVLMRGNHEGPEDLMASPHDLPIQFQRKFGKLWHAAYNKILEMTTHLYNAVIVENQYLMVHGGLPVHARKIEDFAYADANHPKTTFLEEILWSDPTDFSEACPSPRGAGKLFGKEVTDNILNALKVKILIRGHECCPEGFKIDHDSKVLTLFSRKGPPYMNLHGAYLDVNLQDQFQNVNELLSYVHKF